MKRELISLFFKDVLIEKRDDSDPIEQWPVATDLEFSPSFRCKSK